MDLGGPDYKSQHAIFLILFTSVTSLTAGKKIKNQRPAAADQQDQHMLCFSAGTVHKITVHIDVEIMLV